MTPTYDLSAFAAELEKWRPIASVKKTMLEAIANIAVAVHDRTPTAWLQSSAT